MSYNDEKNKILSLNSPGSYLKKCVYDNINDIRERDIDHSKKRKNKIKKQKVKDDEFMIPKFNDYENLNRLNYNVSQLKKICKSYKLKSTGNKEQLIHKCYNYLKYSLFAVKIQSFFKGFITRKYYSLIKISLNERNKCVNDTDFLTLDELKELPFYQFFCIKDEDNFSYGFDICSLYNLMKQSGKDSKNPYTRKIIPLETIKHLRKIIRFSHLLKFPIKVVIEDEKEELSEEQKLNIKCTGIFQKIDELGNYSNSDWFLDLSRENIIIFIKELYDIWNYRAQITYDTKMRICPPFASPFDNIHINILQMKHIKQLQLDAINIIEKLVTKGINNESKNLGAFYVLGALTLVNQQAAQSLPWLYESFYHN